MGHKHICQSISGLWALLKISAGWRRRTQLNGRLAVDDCRLWEQNRITSMWLNAVKKATQGLAEVQEKLEIWQQYLLALAAVRSCHGHKYVIANDFCENATGFFDYIIILCKILTHFYTVLISSRVERNDHWNVVLFVQVKQIQYKQHFLGF